jgi:hypothetical protein
MRRRNRRDLFTLIGVVVVLTAIIGVNGYMRREGLRGQYEAMRAAFEKKHLEKGVQLIDWKELHQVKGTRRSGATFPDSLKEKDSHLVNLCGFMSPIDQFKNVTEFMLLPVPMTCYFCDSPPMRDIVMVKLSKPADMVNEPVLIGGRLELHKGEKELFFYTIKDAKWNEAVKDEELSKKTLDQAHKTHLVDGFKELRDGKPEEVLTPGYTPPANPTSIPAGPVTAPAQPAEPASPVPAPPAAQ